MNLREIKPISLLRLSFVTGIVGYASLSLAPAEWGLVKAGLILTVVAAAAFCLFMAQKERPDAGGTEKQDRLHIHDDAAVSIPDRGFQTVLENFRGRGGDAAFHEQPADIRVRHVFSDDKILVAHRFSFLPGLNHFQPSRPANGHRR